MIVLQWYLLGLASFLWLNVCIICYAHMISFIASVENLVYALSNRKYALEQMSKDEYNQGIKSIFVLLWHELFYVLLGPFMFGLGIAFLLGVFYG